MIKFNEKITEIESKENLSTVVKLLKKINRCFGEVKIKKR